MPGSVLARQITMLGLAMCAVALAVAFPLRNYLSDRAAYAETITQQHVLEAHVAQLEQRKTALSDPDYIAYEARKRLQFVRPGDTVYVVRPPVTPPSSRSPAPAAQKPSAEPWYSGLWDTLSEPTGTAGTPKR